MQTLAGGKWSSGTSYGPVLSQTDLYILRQPIELNPIFRRADGAFQLTFHLVTGQADGQSADGSSNVFDKEEPATLPRVQQLYIISRWSPWCTVVRNERGVTMGDFCTQVWKDYNDHHVTDMELAALPTRRATQVRHIAANNISHTPQHPSAWGGYNFSPGVDPNSVRPRRSDWLLDRQYFDMLEYEPNYTQDRLGFAAANVFIMNLSNI